MDIQNEKLEAEITYKNQELALTTMHLVQKAEILLTVQEGLNQILGKSPDQTVKKEVQQLVRDSLRGIVEYDTWFKTKVQAAQADPRPAIGSTEWDAIRAQKLAQRKALADKA